MTTDATLLRLCGEGIALDDQSSGNPDQADGLQLSDPRYQAAWDQAATLSDQIHARVQGAAALPALTREGLQAKASLALRWIVGQDMNALALVVSVLEQVAGWPGPIDHPDAELIRLCRDLDATERRRLAVFARHDHTDAEVEAISVAVRAEQLPILDQIDELRPTTLDGARALKTSLLLLNPILAKGGCPDDRVASVLVRGLATIVHL